MTETKRITHSSQNGNQEQTARRCQEPELEEGEKKKGRMSQTTPEPTFAPSLPLTFGFIAQTLCKDVNQ